MEIITNTVYDEKAIKTFISFNIFKGKNHSQKKNLFYFIGIFAFIMAGLLIVLTLVNKDYNELFFALFLTVILTLVFCLLFIFLPKLAYKNNQKLLNETIRYTFNTEVFSINAETKCIKASEIIKYPFLYKVYDFNDYIYMFVNFNNGYIVDKSKFENGTAEELINILKQQLPSNKYIICK